MNHQNGGVRKSVFTQQNENPLKQNGTQVSWLTFEAKPKITITVTRTIHRRYTEKCSPLARLTIFSTRSLH